MNFADLNLTNKSKAFYRNKDVVARKRKTTLKTSEGADAFNRASA